MFDGEGHGFFGVDGDEVGFEETVLDAAFDVLVCVLLLLGVVVDD